MSEGLVYLVFAIGIALSFTSNVYEEMSGGTGNYSGLAAHEDRVVRIPFEEWQLTKIENGGYRINQSLLDLEKTPDSLTISMASNEPEVLAREGTYSLYIKTAKWNKPSTAKQIEEVVKNEFSECENYSQKNRSRGSTVTVTHVCENISGTEIGKVVLARYTTNLHRFVSTSYTWTGKNIKINDTKTWPVSQRILKNKRKQLKNDIFLETDYTPPLSGGVFYTELLLNPSDFSSSIKGQL